MLCLSATEHCPVFDLSGLETGMPKHGCFNILGSSSEAFEFMYTTIASDFSRFILMYMHLSAVAVAALCVMV
jgi:hypothetical protein